ncbi:jg25325 [Pararge aegeria aegeria]|uniref:Jg25325 protein n=1 Tax=Pararge aegeria aegeria TaxID=348720 RepID=A0A8S4S4V6_9NEOP|nr:jg25325 [Pararge aegeria aegeria]
MKYYIEISGVNPRASKSTLSCGSGYYHLLSPPIRIKAAWWDFPVWYLLRVLLRLVPDAAPWTALLLRPLLVAVAPYECRGSSKYQRSQQWRFAKGAYLGLRLITP